MKIYLTIFLFISIAFATKAQDSTKYTLNLEDAVTLAKQQSVASLMAETQKETSFWQYKTYRSGLYPQLSLAGTLPDFSRTFNSVVQPDGSIQFQPVVNNNSSLNLQLSQNVALTGGQLFINSQVQRFDDLDRDITRYNGNPVSFGYRQTIFGFNRFRWDRQTEPLKYEISKRKYLSAQEAVSLQSIAFYFNLLLAQTDYRMAQQNVESGKKNLEIAKVRYEMGRISENDLIQVRYTLLNSQSALARAVQDMQTATLQLKSYMGLDENRLQLTEPQEIPRLYIQEEFALNEARKNKETWLEFKVKLIEAQRDVNKTKMENGFNADLILAFGLTSRADYLKDVYHNPADQQIVRLGFNMPLVDWGGNKALYKTAKATQKLTDYTIKQDQLIFEQQILTQVALINSLETQIEVTREASQLASQRFRITTESFGLGKISITELNIAQQEKDQAYRNYLITLKNYWETYYRLRMLTLYDFEKQEPIVPIYN